MKKIFLKRIIWTQKQDKHLCGPEMEQKCRAWSEVSDLLDSRSRVAARDREGSGSCWLMDLRSTCGDTVRRSRPLCEIKAWEAVEWLSSALHERKL